MNYEISRRTTRDLSNANNGIFFRAADKPGCNIRFAAFTALSRRSVVDVRLKSRSPYLSTLTNLSETDNKRNGATERGMTLSLPCVTVGPCGHQTLNNHVVMPSAFYVTNIIAQAAGQSLNLAVQCFATPFFSYWWYLCSILEPACASSCITQSL